MRHAFSASVFCRRDTRVLLIKHKLLGLWLPVGGELEMTSVQEKTETSRTKHTRLETPLEAATREVREETRFIVSFPTIKHAPAGTPPGFIGYEEHTAGPKGYHMNFCFLANVIGGGTPDLEPISDGSWSEHRWVNPHSVQGDKSLEMPKNVRDLLWQLLLTKTE